MESDATVHTSLCVWTSNLLWNPVQATTAPMCARPAASQMRRALSVTLSTVWFAATVLMPSNCSCRLKPASTVFKTLDSNGLSQRRLDFLETFQPSRHEEMGVKRPWGWEGGGGENGGDRQMSHHLPR